MPVYCPAESSVSIERGKQRYTWPRRRLEELSPIGQLSGGGFASVHKCTYAGYDGLLVLKSFHVSKCISEHDKEMVNGTSSTYICWRLLEQRMQLHTLVPADAHSFYIHHNACSHVMPTGSSLMLINVAASCHTTPS